MCYFATDIHSHSLGEGKKDDSLERAKDIKGELVMVSLSAIDSGGKPEHWADIRAT